MKGKPLKKQKNFWEIYVMESLTPERVILKP